MRVTDLATKKPVTVTVDAESNLRKLPAQMAQMLAARNRPPEEGAGRGSAGAAAAAKDEARAGAERDLAGAGAAEAI